MCECSQPLVLRGELVLTGRNREWQSRHHSEQWAEDGRWKREGEMEGGRDGGMEGE